MSNLLSWIDYDGVNRTIKIYIEIAIQQLPVVWLLTGIANGDIDKIGRLPTLGLNSSVGRVLAR